jgi:hypothetical protein
MGVSVTFTPEQENIIGKMFAAAMREKISQLARNYGQETMFQSWVEYVKERRGKGQALEGRWDPDLSLAEALDILDEDSGSIERSIQKRLEEGRKNQE